MTTATRIVNFSAGPAVLPVEVLEEAQRNLVTLPGVGMSVLEISHRSTAFDEIIERCEADLRELANLPEGYHVLFLQGGASLQFSMVPMNLLPAGLLPSLSRGDGTLGIRPHDITVVAPGAGDSDALVDVVEPRGSELLLYLRLGVGGGGPEIRGITPPDLDVAPDRVVGLRFDRARLHLFRQAGRLRGQRAQVTARLDGKLQLGVTQEAAWPHAFEPGTRWVVT